MSSNPPTEPAPERRRWRVILTRGAFVCAALLTLVAAFYLVERQRGRAMWQKYEAEARARQVKLYLMELVPAPVPDAENFAAVPIFQDAFDKPNAPNPFALLERPGEKAPSLGAAVKNELVDLGEWQKFFIATKTLSTASGNPAEDVLQALEHYAAAWEQLRTAAARPRSRFPVRYEDGINASMPHVGVLQSAAKLNALRLLAHLQLGDSAAAYEDFRLGMRLRESLETEPTLICSLVRLSQLAMLENAVWTGLARHQWAAPELEKITADLGRPRLMDDYALGLGGERGFSNMIHEQLMRESPEEFAKLVSLTTEAGTQRGLFQLGMAPIYWLYPNGWLRFSQTRANRYFDEMLSRVTQEPPRLYADRKVDTLPANMESVSTVERAQYLLFFLLAPALNEVERSYAYGQTLLDQARLGCALERHRLANGSFPASLDALAPGLIPEVPRDVMNGLPFHYRTDANGGYTLYSVAMNLQDEGGKSDRNAVAKQQPDWVWSVPGK